MNDGPDFGAHQFQDERDLSGLCNIEAEQAVLGAVLLKNDVFWEFEGFLRPEHFYEPLHARLFDEFCKLIRGGRVADNVTLKPRFTADEDMKEVGGFGYLGRLVGASVSILNAADYARTVADFARRRHLRQASNVIKDLSLDLGTGMDDAMAGAETALSEVADEGRAGERIRTIGETIDAALRQATEAAKRDDGMVGVPSGLPKLDDVLGGFRDNDLIIIAGRPGMGKSALAVKLAVEGARLAGAGIGLISLEMKGEDLANRALSAEIAGAGMDLPYSDISRGLLSGGQTDQLALASSDLRGIPLHIEDTGRKTVGQIRSIARAIDRGFKKEGNRLGCLIIDHLSIIAPDKAYRGNKVAETEQISNELKSLAKQLQIPVVALCQLSRNVDTRENKRPYMSDLRFSGAIEQDADVIIFVHRPAYYMDQDKPDTWHENYPDWKIKREEVQHRLDLTIAKNRNGKTCDIDLYCKIECNLILDQRPYLGQQGAFEIET